MSHLVCNNCKCSDFLPSTSNVFFCRNCSFENIVPLEEDGKLEAIPLSKDERKHAMEFRVGKCGSRDFDDFKSAFQRKVLGESYESWLEKGNRRKF